MIEWRILRISVYLVPLLCFGSAHAQQVFDLSVPGTNVRSSAELDAATLKITQQGQTATLRRDQSYDREGYIGYSNRELRQAILWPANNRGNFQIGRITEGGIAGFQPSGMRIEPRQVVGPPVSRAEPRTLSLNDRVRRQETLVNFSVVLSPDGDLAVSASRWLNPQTGSSLGAIQLWKVKIAEHFRTFRSYIHVALRPDGKTLAAAVADGGVRLFDLASLEEIGVLDTPAVHFVAFSPDGNLLAAVTADGVQLWDIRTRTPKEVFLPQRALLAVAFSPDGRTLAGAGGTRSVILWDVESGRVTRTFTGHAQSIFALAFHPDGKILASAADGDRELRRPGEIKLWDVTNGAPQPAVATLQGQAPVVRSLAFSPDGKVLASAGGTWDFQQPGAITLWDIATRRPSERLTGHQGCVFSVCYSRDGSKLASGSADLSIKLWPVKIEQPPPVAPMPDQTLLLVVNAEDQRQPGRQLPVKGAKISIKPEGTAPVREEDGFYRVEVKSGAYEVTVERAGYKPKTGLVTIQAGEPVTRHEILLNQLIRPAVPMPDRTLLLVVKGLDPLQPGRQIQIKDAKVSVKPGSAPPVQDENGLYRLSVKPGEYEVTVARAGYKTKSETITVGVDDRVGSRDIVLEAASYTLEVRVLDDRQRPIAGLKVGADGPGIEPDDADGTTSYAFRVPSGRYEVTAEVIAGVDEIAFDTKQITIDASPQELQLKPRRESTIDERLRRLFDRLNRKKDDVLNEDDFLGTGWEDLTLRLNKVGAIDLVAEDLRPLLESSDAETVTDRPPPSAPQEPPLAQRLARLWERLNLKKDGTLNEDDFAGTGWEDITLRLNKVGSEELIAEDLLPLLESNDNQDADNPQPAAVEQQLSLAERLARLWDRLNVQQDDTLNEADFTGTGWDDIRQRLNKVGSQELNAEDLRPLLESSSEPQTEDTDAPTVPVGTLIIRRLADEE